MRWSWFLAGWLVLAGGSAHAADGLRMFVVSKGSNWRPAALLASYLDRNLPKRAVAVVPPVVRTFDPTDPNYERFRTAGRIAVRAYKRGRYRRAIKALNVAISRLETLMIRYGPIPLLLSKFVRAHYYLGAAKLKSADPEGAARAFRLAAFYAPDRNPSPRRFDREVLDAFERAVRARGQVGLLSIRPTVPAQVFLDGRDVGIAPVTLKQVAFGRHFVVLYRLGYPVLAKFVELDSREGAMWTPHLVPDPNAKELVALAERVERELRLHRKGGKAALALAQRLGGGEFVFCRASVDEAEASWYVSRAKRYKKRVRRPNPVPGQPALQDIFEALMRPEPRFDLGSALAAACVSDADCPGGKCIAGKCIKERPFYKRWWFWVAVGAGVAAAAAAGAVVATMPQRPILNVSSPP